MNSEQQELWSKIRDFDIDAGPVSFSFAKRLARENGWSLAYANRVIDEYKRFVFLCMAAGHACTPSDEVDQAWHLHLTYTESYWTRLTQEILPRPLHHGPTKGGDKEAAKFVDWYEKTKESYQAMFGEEPPLDIWPTTEARFAGAAGWKRVDTSQFWMIPKNALRRSTAWVTGLAAILLGGVGCGYLAQAGGNNLVAIFVILAILGFVILVIIATAASNRRGGNQGNGSTGCSTTTGGCSSTSSHSGCGSHGDGGSGCGSSGCGGGGCGGGGCGGGGD